MIATLVFIVASHLWLTFPQSDAKVSHSVVVGKVSVLLNAPAGMTFAEGRMNNDMTALLKKQGGLPETNELLAYYANKLDMLSSLKSGRTKMRRYCLVEIISQLKPVNATHSQFEIFKERARKVTNSRIGKNMQELNNDVRRKATNLTIDTVVPLGEIDASSNHVSQLFAVKYGNNASVMVGSSSFLLLHSKILMFYAYSVYAGQSDTEWVIKTTQSFIDDAIMLNNNP